jgi:hypothetical protein
MAQAVLVAAVEPMVQDLKMMAEQALRIRVEQAVTALIMAQSMQAVAEVERSMQDQMEMQQENLAAMAVQA